MSQSALHIKKNNISLLNCEHPFSILTTDSVLDLGVGFDWAILTHELALI